MISIFDKRLFNQHDVLFDLDPQRTRHALLSTLPCPRWTARIMRNTNQWPHRSPVSLVACAAATCAFALAYRVLAQL